jgi:hypothetical protein
MHASCTPGSRIGILSTVIERVFMTRCPTCETEFADAAAGCPACAPAAAEPETVECARCGESYAGGDSCPFCGTLHLEVPCDEHTAAAAAGRCVLCGRAVCTECVAGDRSVTLCREHEKVVLIEQWAQVYSTTSELEAQLLRENLRADGMDAQVYSQKDMMFNVDLGELSIVRLLVPVWEYEQALRTIQGHMDMQGEVAFACTSCGEPFEPGARECAACGAALV